MSTVAGDTTLQIIKTELYVPVVTLNTKNTKKTSTLLEEGFKRSLAWNEYKSKIQRVETGDGNENLNQLRIFLDSSFQGVNKLIVAAYNVGNTGVPKNDHKKYYQPTVEVKQYNILIDDGNFYDQNVNDSITRYNKLLKLTSGKGEDYTTGCLLDYYYYLKSFNIVAIDLSKQSILDSDPRIAQQLEFIYRLDGNTKAEILTVLEKEKETILEFSKGDVTLL